MPAEAKIVAVIRIAYERVTLDSKSELVPVSMYVRGCIMTY